MIIKYTVYECDTAQGHVRKFKKFSSEKVEESIAKHKALKDTEFTWYEIEVEYSL